jgi:F-type H+-transporting ATPase subunit alpha
MKQVAGKLKLDLAQYRELSAFSQFESDLDEETKKFLNRGAKMTQILKQRNSNPYDLASQVAVIWAAKEGYLDDMPVAKVEEFEERFLSDINTRGKKLMQVINDKKALSEEMEKELAQYAKDNLIEE